MKDQVLQWGDLWFLPPSEALVVVHLHHVVGEELAEAHFVRLWLGLQLVGGCQSHGQVVVLSVGEAERQQRN